MSVTVRRPRSTLKCAMRWVLLVLTLMASACSATPGDAPDGGARLSDAMLGTGGGAGDVVPGSCRAPLDQRPDGSTCVLQATGSVEDLSGAPLPGLLMTFCGRQCYGGRSDNAGAF